MLALLARAKAIGAQTVQLFAANPRSWQGRSISQEEADVFLSQQAHFGVRQVVIHAIYLVNLASPREDVRENSLQALRRDLQSAQLLRAAAVVVHPGSHVGRPGGRERLIAGLQVLQSSIPLGCKLLLEGMAGAKNSLGDLRTLGQVLKRVGIKQFGLCLDSAHLFASGYDLRSEDGVKMLEMDVKRYVGGSRTIGCVHLNDAKHPCGSKRDQHENLGAGTIGRAGLVKLLALPMLSHCAVIMETPGFNQLGPDKKNMQRLRSLARLAGQQGHKES